MAGLWLSSTYSWILDFVSVNRPALKWTGDTIFHYNDVIMGTLASQITSLATVYSIVYYDADQRKHQSSASPAFVRGIHRWLVNSPHKGPVTRKMFLFDYVIMCCSQQSYSYGWVWYFLHNFVPYIHDWTLELSALNRIYITWCILLRVAYLWAPIRRQAIIWTTQYACMLHPASISPIQIWPSCCFFVLSAARKKQGAVSIRKTVLPGMAIPMLKIRRPNGRLIFNMEIAIRR